MRTAAEPMLPRWHVHDRVHVAVRCPPTPNFEGNVGADPEESACHSFDHAAGP
jgi:hypothetical protein